MTPFEQQFEELKTLCPNAKHTVQQSGAHLIEIPNYRLPSGWDLAEGMILFLAPPGFPAAQPDCFWVEPGPVRFGGGQTPQGSNDSNPIPGIGPRGTWFSWHLQSWNPNKDSLTTYFRVIELRLCPAR